MTVRGVQHIFVGNLNKDTAVLDIEMLLGDYKYDHPFEIYEGKNIISKESFVFSVINANETDTVKPLALALKRNTIKIANQIKAKDRSICIRQYITRSKDNDRRKADHSDRDMLRQRVERRIDKARIVYRSNENLMAKNINCIAV
jgi:hypothetical protein